MTIISFGRHLCVGRTIITISDRNERIFGDNGQKIWFNLFYWDVNNTDNFAFILWYLFVWHGFSQNCHFDQKIIIWKKLHSPVILHRVSYNITDEKLGICIRYGRIYSSEFSFLFHYAFFSILLVMECY